MLRLRRVLPSALLLLAACSSSEEGASSAASDLIQAKVARVTDARTDPRFFRDHGAFATAPVEVNGRSLFLGKKGVRNPGDSRVPSEDWLYEATGADARPIMKLDHLSGSSMHAAAAGSLYWFATAPNHEDTLMRTDGASAPSAVTTGNYSSQLVGTKNALYLLEYGHGLEAMDQKKLVRISRDASGADVVTKLWEGTADIGDGIFRANDSGVVLRANGKIFFAPDGGALVEVANAPAADSSIFSTKSRFFTKQGSRLFEVASSSLKELGDVSAYDHVTELGNQLVFIGDRGIQTVGVNGDIETIAVPGLGLIAATVQHQGKLYILTRSGELHETDGRTSSRLGVQLGVTRSPTPLVADGSSLYFLGDDTTMQVRRFDLGSSTKETVTKFPEGARIRDLTVVNHSVVFSAGADDRDEVWSVTAGNAKMIETNPYGNHSSEPAVFGATRKLAYFTTVADQPDPFGVPKSELWATDGKPNGTRRLSAGTYPRTDDTYGPNIFATAGEAMCVVEKTTDAHYLCTNGTTTATYRIANDTSTAKPTAFKDGLFLATLGASGTKDILRIDGTTGAATTIASLPAGAVVKSLVATKNSVLVVVDGDASARGVWRSDGTAAVHTLAAAPFPAPKSALLGTLGDSAFYFADGSVFATDGATVSAGVKVARGAWATVSGQALDSRFLVNAEGKLWAFGNGGDGAMIYGATDVFASEPTEFDHRLAYATGPNLLLTDGTVAGTKVVPGLGLGSRYTKFPRGGLIVSTNRPADNRREITLVDKDGRTTVLDDKNSAYTELVTTDYGAIFDGDSPEKGRELFFTYGTLSSRPWALDEVQPGAASSNPHNLFVWDRQLLFTATDKDGDVELYTISTDL